MAIAVRKDLWLLARELAEALAEAPEVLRFRRAEDELLADPEAVDLVKAYESAKRAVKFSRGKPPAEQARLIEEFLALEERFNAHPRIQAYVQARQELDLLLERLNTVITYPITGAEAPPRPGGCGAGGGCGCGG